MEYCKIKLNSNANDRSRWNKDSAWFCTGAMPLMDTLLLKGSMTHHVLADGSSTQSKQTYHMHPISVNSACLDIWITELAIIVSDARVFQTLNYFDKIDLSFKTGKWAGMV